MTFISVESEFQVTTEDILKFLQNGIIMTLDSHCARARFIRFLELEIMIEPHSTHYMGYGEARRHQKTNENNEMYVVRVYDKFMRSTLRYL